MSVQNRTPYEAWEDYYTYGGLPYLATLGTDQKKINYLRDVYETVYLKDIADRYKLRRESELKELIQIIASSIGSPINPNKLENTFKSLKTQTLSAKTIEKYLTYACESFMAEKAIRFNINPSLEVSSN